MFVIAANILLFTACNEKEAISLTVLPVKLDFTADDPSEKTVFVETNKKGWEVNTTFGWINIVKRDNFFTVTVTKYTETTDFRTGTITVKAAGKEIPVTVFQSAAVESTLSLSKTSLVFEAEIYDSQDVVIIATGANWDYSIPPTCTWLTLEKTGNTLSVTPAGLNFGAEPRLATITITAGNATPAQLQITQEVSYNLYPSFDTAVGVYFGNTGAGTTLFGLDMFNASDDNMGIQILGFSAYASAEKFKLDVGTFRLTEYGEGRSFFGGEYDTEEDSYFGTIAYDFNLGENTLITGGSFNVELSGNTYTIITNFTGKNALTNATVENIRFSYTGTIEFEDASIDMFSTGIAESDYTATGTPQLSFQGGGGDASVWDGLVVPVEDDYGQYLAIINFADEDIPIYADFIFGRFILDTYYPIWEDNDYIGFLEVVFIHDGELWGVDADWVEPSIQYDHESQTIDFSKSFDFSDFGYPEIGLKNLSVGVYAYQKSDGQPAGWLTNIYPDVRLSLTPVSSASKLGSKAVLNKKVISHSELTSLTRSADKNLKMKDKAQLVPVDQKKLDRNLKDGKLIDRKTFQKTTKK